MSEKNIKFIEELKKTYDFVIIDSPPIGLVADSFELMKYTDANVYVVRHEYTEKYMLKMITEKYHNKEVQHLGLIYNDFSVEKGYGYGYGYGYGGDTTGGGYYEDDDTSTAGKIKNIFKKKKD
jgi:Mrp family chromosome partitioning ATPase